MKVSYPTKLTASLQKRFFALARKGHHLKTICQACGIHRDTYYEWLNRAVAGEKPFEIWANAVHQVRAEYLIELYERHEKMATKAKDLPSLRWMMERGWPGLFGNRLRIDADMIDERIHAELARLAAGRLGGVANRGEGGILSAIAGHAVAIEGGDVAGVEGIAQQEDWEALPAEFGASASVSSKPGALQIAAGRIGKRKNDGGKFRGAKKNQGRAVGRDRKSRLQSF